MIYVYSLWISFALSLLLIIGLSYTSFIFKSEKENKAATKALLLALLLPIPYFLAWYYQWEIVSLILCADLFIFTILFLIPFPYSKNLTNSFPTKRLDERDIMFSRNELTENTNRYQEYYSKYPEKKILDDQFRKEAGLCSPESIFYNEIAYKAASASFFTVEQFKKAVDGEINPVKTSLDTKQISDFLKLWGKKLGALDTGICKLENYHFYTHKGRGDEYGKEIHSSHRFAIAFTVEMNEEMVAAAPQSSIIMESGQQYLEAGRIAVQIAAFIRNLGYSARAHIDGNYQVICPLVARDSGLGEIGRMGLLMTPKQGPRVRLGVVTCDLELQTNQWKKNNALLDFCNRCKKCATICPSQSISFDAPKMVDGIRRWQIDSESCFTYWCKAGTDCGRCMASCPYSHPDNFLHNFIRWGIQHSTFFRILAVYLDDFFYGRKRKPKKIPKWIPQKKSAN